MGPGGLWWSNVLNVALLPQRLRSDTSPEHQDPLSHTAQKKQENKKERKKEKKKKKREEMKRKKKNRKEIKLLK